MPSYSSPCVYVGKGGNGWVSRSEELGYILCSSGSFCRMGCVFVECFGAASQSSEGSKQTLLFPEQTQM